MKCQDVEEKILTGNLGEQESAHIAVCDACREFQKIHDELMVLPDTSGVEPPELQTLLSSAAARTRRRFRLIGSGIAAGVAASIAVVGVLALSAPVGPAPAVNTASGLVSYSVAESSSDPLAEVDTISLSWDRSDELTEFSNAISAASWRIDVYNPLIMEDM